MKTEFDVAIIGAGIIGLATARALKAKAPARRIAVLDKEAEVAGHQSGRNSGVIHSGLYYRPGSLKASLCVSGAERMVRFCEERAVPYSRDGKVVVATRESQLGALAELERRGHANGLVGLRRISRAELEEFEPHARAIAALRVPSTGAVDYGRVSRMIAGELEASGAVIRTGFPVERIEASSGGVVIEGREGSLTASGIVNCAGLFSDRVARTAGVEPEVQIVPFRGEYFDVGGASADLVRSSIYPVPDPRMPFLGVHLTRSPDGLVHAGPNAVLAAAREGYGWGTVRPGELWEAVRYRGLRLLARRHWRSGIGEVVRSLSRKRFTAAVRDLVPGVQASDLRRGRSGVRAQAVTRDGTLHDDFLIQHGLRSVHVLNAPSPAATAAFAIGDHVADRVVDVLDLA